MMKWVMMAVVACVFASAPVQAHCGKCGADGHKEKAACTKGSKCDSWTKGITLTDEQKTKVDALKAGCDGSKESCDKAKAGIRAVLTEEQQKAFDANTTSSCGSKSGCGGKKAACKGDDKA